MRLVFINKAKSPSSHASKNKSVYDVPFAIVLYNMYKRQLRRNGVITSELIDI